MIFCRAEVKHMLDMDSDDEAALMEMCSSDSSESSDHTSDQSDHAERSTSEAVFCVVSSTAEKLIDLWKEKANSSSPLRKCRPFEHGLYSRLASLSVPDVSPFATALGDGIAGCLSAGSRRKEDDAKTILFGKACAQLRSSEALRQRIASLVGGADSSSAAQDAVAAICASTVDYMLSHPRSSVVLTASSSVGADKTSTLSSEEQAKVNYHGGWTLKRVRDRLLRSRRPFEALDREGSLVLCNSGDVLGLLSLLGLDQLSSEGRYLLIPDSRTCKFFSVLHDFAESYFNEKVMGLLLLSCVCVFVCIKYLRKTNRAATIREKCHLL